MPRRRFTAQVRPSGRGGGHLVEVPADVARALGGGGRIPVTAAFDGVPYRGSLVTMGGAMVLGITKAIMAEAGVAAGDAVTVVVENDDAPREVTLPEELEAALRKDRVARAAFEALAYTHRREYADHVAEAKRADTRARRVEETIRALHERAAAT